jgi:uncharacterized membrane protein
MAVRDARAERAGDLSSPAAGIAEPLAKNIATLMERREREMAAAPASERVSAAVAGFLGSMWSVAVHALIFGLWILVNLGLVPWIRPFDPSLVVLAMIASVEAIFLTTFVLVNQKRLARIEEERSELALQIALLSEREVSKLVELTADVARHLQVPVEKEVDSLAEETMPDAVLDEIRRRRPDSL